MGGSLMAYDCDVPRGALNVAGSTWSLLFQRSSDWSQFALLIGGSYPAPFDQQVLLALAQSQFDFTDPINAAGHWFQSPLAGCPKKHILQQMVIGDAQVPNVSSEILARTGGLGLLDDSPIAVFGMTPAAPPLDDALTIWDMHASPLPPDTNVGLHADNGVHGALIEMVPEAQHQVAQFLKTGQIVSTCSGTCDPG